MNEQEESRIFTEELTVAWQRYCDECNLEKNNIVDYGFWLQNEFALHLWLSNRSLREKVERLDKLTDELESENFSLKEDWNRAEPDLKRMAGEIKELEEKVGAIAAQRDLFAEALRLCGDEKIVTLCYNNDNKQTRLVAKAIITAQSLQGKVNG